MRTPGTKLAALLAITAAAFSPALGAGFLHWDDSTHILNNRFLNSGDWLAFWREPYYRLYIPVIYTAWTALAAITKKAWLFHAFTLGLHLLNGVLVYRLTRKAWPKLPEAGALIATAAFLLHPIQDEGAAWIGGARDSMASALGLMAALLLFSDRVQGWMGALLSTVVFTLGLLAKATIAPLPVALLLLPGLWERMNRARAMAAAAWLASAVVVLYVNKVVQQSDADRMVEPVSLLARPLIALDALGYYLIKIVLPYPLASDYGRIPKVVIDEAWYIWPALVFLAVAGAAVFAYYKYRDRMPLIALTFYIFILGPVLGLIPFMAQAQSTVANRYVYLAILGPCWLLGFAVTRWPRLRSAALAVLAVWAGLSFARAQVYSENDVFFSAMLKYNPDSLPGHTTMGVVKFVGGRLDLAIEHFKQAHRLSPLNVSPVSNWAQALWELNRYKDILTDIEPNFNNPEFITYNDNNKAALARALRVIAQSHIVFRNWRAANERMCQGLELDQTNADLVADFMNFEREAAAVGHLVVRCRLP